MAHLPQCGKRRVARRGWTAPKCGGRSAVQQGMLRLAALQAALRVVALQQGMLRLAALQGSLRQLALQTTSARGVGGPWPSDALQGRTGLSVVAATGAWRAVETLENTRERAPNACGRMQPLLEVWC